MEFYSAYFYSGQIYSQLDIHVNVCPVESKFDLV